MNKTAIKNFAIWARNKLIADIKYKAGLMGITEKGIAGALPQSAGGTEFYDIGTSEPYCISGKEIEQRRRLKEVIENKAADTDYSIAYKYVIEEVAYTWFNRLIAIRFMEVNDYLPSHIRVLSSESGKMEPDLVTSPFDTDLEFTREEEQRVIQLKQDNQVDELFRILFIKQCNTLNKILPLLFEETSDYSELLLNLSIIDKDGVIFHLVNDIPETDFNVEQGGQVEIIGWLYQYYNTEPKDETFSLLKKNVKITKERVPFATQLFTPDWIVKYMVENSLGRLWLEGHPNEVIKNDWKYYIDESEQDDDVQNKMDSIREEVKLLKPEDIKVIDPCMGSGHILVYAFDVLMRIYENAGYSQRDASKSIIENNIYGIDIDERAFQIAYFSVLMKARQYNRRILNDSVVCNVYEIVESNGINREHFKYFGNSLTDKERKCALKQINELLDDFVDAKEYGSILYIRKYDFELLNRFCENTNEYGQLTMESWGIEKTQTLVKKIITIAGVLNNRYHSVITNPPYMGSGNMNAKLLNYVKKYYPKTKSDLSTVMMEKSIRMCKTNGFMAMINIPAWMFLASFEKMREELLINHSFCNMIHFGRGVFGADFGTTAFVIRQQHIVNYVANYRRLFDKQSSVDALELKEKWFFEGKGQHFSRQESFTKIPGAPIAYWISDAMFSAFEGQLLSDYGKTRQGFATGDNNKFLRVWYEVDFEDIGLGFSDYESFLESNYKYAPCNKGGDFRKWYGNNYIICRFDKEAFNILATQGNHLPSKEYYFKGGLTWSALSIGMLSMRLAEEGFVFETKGSRYFLNDNQYLYYLLGLMNSSVVMEALKVLCPTIDFHEGPVSKVPVIMGSKEEVDEVNRIVNENIRLAKEDWDSSEISWNFKKHPLVPTKIKMGQSLKIADVLDEEENKRECCFLQMKNNEEKLNRIFARIYKMNDEIDFEVEECNVSVQRIDRQKEIKALISYAVGCMFGRYSLDQEGLLCTGIKLNYDNYETFIPDDDAIIPITDEEYLEDDIVSRFCLWIKNVYGEETLEENLDFVAKTLKCKGNSSRNIIRNYFLNEFFKDHCQLYSVTGAGKKPIYWLFDSGKQNGFKALIYIHRYTEDTIGNLRVDYLHRMQRVYESEMVRMQEMQDNSTNAREVAMAEKRQEKLRKQLKECREYDERIGHLALARIHLDIDDGIKENYQKIQIGKDGKKYQVLAKV